MSSSTRAKNLKRLLKPRHIAFFGGEALGDPIRSCESAGFEGEIWVLEIAPDDHAPIRQDAALLVRGADNAAAQGFYRFLSSDFVRFILADAGYDLPEEAGE